MIVVNKRPNDRCWSGNPIHYTLFSAAAEADTTIFFQYRIRFKRTDAAAFVTLIELDYKPVLGTAKIDIEDIIDGNLEYDLPYLAGSNEFSSPFFANKSTGKFYLQFREITTGDPDPAWVDTESAHQSFIIKGGISFLKWRGDNYWVNYFDIVKPFLTWEMNYSLHSISERMYLAWLNLTDIGPADIKMKRTVKFTDGSEDVALLNCPVPVNHVCYFPSGGKQLEIQTIDPAKNIFYWELQVIKVNVNPGEPLSEAFRYYNDNRVDYNGITLNYRNSLGGIGSVRIRGTIEQTLERQFTQVEKIVLHDYFAGIFVSGRVEAQNSFEILIYKGDTGHLGKEEQDRLRDIHFKRECWWEQQLKWMPVMLLTGSQKLRTSNDKLFSKPIDFCIASGGEKFYTPDSINLAEGALPVGNVCTAVIGDLASIFVPGTGWAISWSLVSGAPNKYFVSTPAVSGGAPHETTSLSYVFNWLPPGDNIITVTPLCLIGGVFYFGASQQITVTVAEACVPVTISGLPIILPDAIEDTPYNFVFNLTGTAPFSLTEIVKPAWMTVALAGSTVVLSGTPLAPATDIDVSFRLTNCTGAGDVNYSDSLDVIADADNGDFVVTNDSTPGNFVKFINTGGSPFYTISTGSIPVGSSAAAVGFLTQNLATAITVGVIIATPGHDIRLFKNGALLQTISVPSSGPYSFAAVAFNITDDMEIVLT